MGLDISMSLITIVVIVLSAGFLSSLSLWTLPTATLMVGYVSGSENTSKRKGFIISLFFVLGMVITLTALGMLIGYLGHFSVNSKSLSYIIGALLLFMGLWMLNIIQINILSRITMYKPKKESGIIGAFLLGLPFGIVHSPCSSPITLSILTFAASNGSPLYGALLMFVFAIGKGIPLVLVGTFTGAIKNIKKLSKYQHIIEKAGGIALIILAFYFVWKA